MSYVRASCQRRWCIYVLSVSYLCVYVLSERTVLYFLCCMCVCCQRGLCCIFVLSVSYVCVCCQRDSVVILCCQRRRCGTCVARWEHCCVCVGTCCPLCCQMGPLFCVCVCVCCWMGPLLCMCVCEVRWDHCSVCVLSDGTTALCLQVHVGACQ